MIGEQAIAVVQVKSINLSLKTFISRTRAQNKAPLDHFLFHPPLDWLDVASGLLRGRNNCYMAYRTRALKTVAEEKRLQHILAQDCPFEWRKANTFAILITDNDRWKHLLYSPPFLALEFSPFHKWILLHGALFIASEYVLSHPQLNFLPIHMRL